MPGSPGVPGLSGSGVDGTGVIGVAGLSGSVVGGVPVAVARFSTSPASFSAWVIVYVAVPAATSPGASSVTSRVTPSVSFASVISTPVSVTLPVLVTVKVYSMVLPSADNTPVLANESDGSAGISTSVGIPGLPGVPGLSGSGVDGTGSIGSAGSSGSVVGGVPVAVARFSTMPASFSPCVTV